MTNNGNKIETVETKLKLHFFDYAIDWIKEGEQNHKKHSILRF